MTKTEICSLAVSHLAGRKFASDVDTLAAAGQNQQAVSCAQWFDATRDEVLRKFPWNFAQARARQEVTYIALGAGVVTNNGGLIQISAATHGLSTGDRIYIKDVEGVTAANGQWYVTVLGVNTFTLDDSVFSGTYVDSTGEWVKIPFFGWDFQHTIPTGCLRVLKLPACGTPNQELAGSVRFKVEQGKILCNSDTIYIEFTKQITDTALWTQDFVNAFTYLLAAYIAQNTAGLSGRAIELRQFYETAMKVLAEMPDANEGLPPQLPDYFDSQLCASRLGWFNTGAG